MRNLFAASSPWFAFGISLHQFPWLAQAVLLGGHVRVGLGGQSLSRQGQARPSNAALVEKAAGIIEILATTSPRRRGARDSRLQAARN